MCRENGQIRAYGAGLLSSFGELKHSLSDKPELRNFDPDKTAIQPYQDLDYQEIYYVAESFDDAKDKFRCVYCRCRDYNHSHITSIYFSKYVAEKLPRRFDVYFDPFTDQVHVVDSVDKLERLINKLSNNVHTLSSCARKLKKQSLE